MGMRISAAWLLWLSAMSGAWATDDPGDVLHRAADLQRSSEIAQVSLHDRWAVYRERIGWGDGALEGGVAYFPDRQLIVSSAEEATWVPMGQPGWVEARVVAFERAELQAKAKIIQFLSNTIDQRRAIDLLQQSEWSHGTMVEVRNAADVASTLERIGKKTLVATEALVTSLIKKLDPDYDLAAFDDHSLEGLRLTLENQFKRKVNSLVLQTLGGVTPVYTTEGEIDGEYRVLVSVVWSPKLNTVAMSLANDVDPARPVSPGEKLEDGVPSDPDVLLGTWGTRVVIDEHGQFAVVAYAQAQPRRAPPGREGSATHDAKKVAATRARAQIVNFIKESLSMRSGEQASQVLREYSDLTFATKTVREYRERITGAKVSVTFRGIRTLKEWSYPHPVTGQPVAGVVAAWSPSSSNMAAQMKDAMSQRATRKAVSPPPKRASQGAHRTLESMPVDTSQY